MVRRRAAPARQAVSETAYLASAPLEGSNGACYMKMKRLGRDAFPFDGLNASNTGNVIIPVVRKWGATELT